MENTTLNLKAKSPTGKETLWQAMKWADTVDKEGIDSGERETFDFMKELKIYNDVYQMAGDSHDLRKWSKQERQKYSFESRENFDNFWF